MMATAAETGPTGSRRCLSPILKTGRLPATQVWDQHVHAMHVTSRQPDSRCSACTGARPSSAERVGGAVAWPVILVHDGSRSMKLRARCRADGRSCVAVCQPLLLLLLASEEYVAAVVTRAFASSD